jgi:hypothetical protein
VSACICDRVAVSVTLDLRQMEKKFVIYNGVRMIEGWPEKIQEAQSHISVVIDGKAYARVRYGEEADDWGADKVACHDCRVIKGQIHVWGCDVERCPACAGQLISCDCNYEGDEEP